MIDCPRHSEARQILNSLLSIQEAHEEKNTEAIVQFFFLFILFFSPFSNTMLSITYNQF